jgi:hypothetical protein
MLAAGLFVAVGFVLASSRPINHDVSFLLLVTSRLLDGAGVYLDDIIDVNPPLILYLYSPVVVATRLLELPEVATSRVYVVMLAGGSLLLCDRLLRHLVGSDSLLRHYLLASLAYSLFISIGHHYGQREHLILLLLAPYLFLAATRARRRPVPRALALAVGVGGGLAASVKPQFVIALIAIEVALAIQRRSLRAWLRPEGVAAVSVGTLYVVSIFLVTPAYVDVAGPLAIDTYWILQRPFPEVLRNSDPALLLLALVSAVVLLRGRENRELVAVLALAAVCLFAAVMIQGVGFRYHWVPANGIALLLCTLLVVWPIERWRAAGDEGRSVGEPSRWVGASVAGTIALVLVLAPSGRLEMLRYGSSWRVGEPSGPLEELVDTIDRYAAGGSVLVLSPNFRDSFPAMSYTSVEWASRFSHLWLVTAVARARRGDPQTPSWLTPERVDAVERYLFDAVAEDIRRHRPELILISRSQGVSVPGAMPILDYLLTDEGFRQLWSSYRLTNEWIGPFRILLRKPEVGP